MQKTSCSCLNSALLNEVIFAEFLALLLRIQCLHECVICVTLDQEDQDDRTNKIIKTIKTKTDQDPVDPVKDLQD